MCPLRNFFALFGVSVFFTAKTAKFSQRIHKDLYAIHLRYYTSRLSFFIKEQYILLKLKFHPGKALPVEYFVLVDFRGKIQRKLYLKY